MARKLKDAWHPKRRTEMSKVSVDFKGLEGKNWLKAIEYFKNKGIDIEPIVMSAWVGC